LQLSIITTAVSWYAGHPDGDGQYFHYLTKWAFALAAMAEATGSKYLRWALELVQRVHPAFVYMVSLLVFVNNGHIQHCWYMLLYSLTLWWHCLP
jgi:hypothetical protein